MIRIVKKDAKLHDHSNMNGDCCFFYDDTVLIDKNWRPEDWLKVVQNHCISLKCPNAYNMGSDPCDSCSTRQDFESGFSACLEALERKAGEK